jgi:hypothetical protein
MILTEKDLKIWSESAFTPLNAVQFKAIIQRFSREPEPYEWTEQDIFTQIRNYLDCGEFVKSMQDNGNTSLSPAGADF